MTSKRTASKPADQPEHAAAPAAAPTISDPRPPHAIVGDDSGKPNPKDVPQAVSDERDPRPPQAEHQGVEPVKQGDGEVADDGAVEAKAPAQSARQRTDHDPKADRAPVHNPDPAEPLPTLGADGKVLPTDHDWLRDGPTFAPPTDARLGMSPHGNVVSDNAHPLGVIGNAPKHDVAPGAYDASLVRAETVDGSMPVPNPPQYVPTSEDATPQYNIDFSASVAVEYHDDAERIRRMQDAADSPHGELAEILDQPFHDSAPADSHGPVQVGDNPAAQARLNTLADLERAAADREHS